jgi:hypothetical protein
MKISRQSQLIKFLLGCPDLCVHPKAYTKEGKLKKRITPLFNLYIKEVNRFLFSGGIRIDVSDALPTDARQDFVNNQAKIWKLQSRLESIWKAGATYGELGFILKPKDGFYKLEFCRHHEITISKPDEVVIEKLKEIQGKEYVYRQVLTPEAYKNYPLVPYGQHKSFKWEQSEKVTPHRYGRVPFLLLKNSEDLFDSHGQPEFDENSIEIALMHLQANIDIAENGHFFGSPILVAPDPDDAIQRLKKRIQVLQADPAEDGGKPEYLNISPIKKEHLSFLHGLEAQFRQNTGLSASYTELPAQVSNVALKTLNAATIDIAQSKWLNYVDQGLEPLFELALHCANLDGFLSNTDTQVSINRAAPYFAESAQEKLQNATYAQALIDMGVDRATALQQTVWSHLTIEEINHMLSPMFDE